MPPNHLAPRRGTGGGGGGGRSGGFSGGGSSSSSGASSGGSSGRSPSGGTFSSVSSGKNGSPASARNVGTGGSRDQLYGPPVGLGGGGSAYPYGYARPFIGAPRPLFGFWPVYWTHDTVNDTEDGQGDTRPGGPLTAMALTTLPDPSSSIYALYGDTESVQAVTPSVVSECGVISNVSTPLDLSTNRTLAQYRSDSFELLYFGSSANASVVGCINDTLIADLPIIGSGSASAHVAPSLGLVVLAFVLSAGRLGSRRL